MSEAPVEIPAGVHGSRAESIRAVAAHTALMRCAQAVAPAAAAAGHTNETATNGTSLHGTHFVACRLMREGADSTYQLARIALPMCEEDFLSMCEERALSGKCGSPLCPNPHVHAAPTTNMHVEWSSLKLVKVTVDQHWCSQECHTKCAQFAHSLGTPVDRLDVLRKLSRRPQDKQDQTNEDREECEAQSQAERPNPKPKPRGRTGTKACAKRVTFADQPCLKDDVVAKEPEPPSSRVTISAAREDSSLPHEPANKPTKRRFKPRPTTAPPAASVTPEASGHEGVDTERKPTDVAALASPAETQQQHPETNAGGSCAATVNSGVSTGVRGDDASGCSDGDREVTPILFFDMQEQRQTDDEGGGGCGVDGAVGTLRVVTAEELQLDEAELDRMRAALDDAHNAAGKGAQPEVQESDAIDDECGEVSLANTDAASQPLPCEAEESDSESNDSDAGPVAAPHREKLKQPRLRSRWRHLDSCPEVPTCPKPTPEQQAKLSQQSVSDAFRFYLAPEYGGVGLPVKGQSLESMAANLRLSAASTDNAASFDDATAPGVAADLQGHHSANTSDGDSDDGSDSDGPERSEDDEGDTEDGVAGLGGVFDVAATARPQLSLFGLIWRLLGEWVTPSTVLFLHARQQEMDCSRSGSAHIRQAFQNLLLARLPSVLEVLNLSVPRAEAHRLLQELIETLYMNSPVPALPSEGVDVIIVAMLGALCNSQRLGCQWEQRAAAAFCTSSAGISTALMQCLIQCMYH